MTAQPTITTEPTDIGTFRAFVEGRGYRIEPITNTIAVAQEGADLRIMGYKMLGPRRSSEIISLDEDGRIDLVRARLAADTWDYATQQVKARRAMRGR